MSDKPLCSAGSEGFSIIEYDEFLREDPDLEKMLGVYNPTRVERQLLVAMSDPDWATGSQMEVLKRYDVSEAMYYRIKKKPHFAKWSRYFGLKLLSNEAGPLIESLIKFAKQGSSPHMKMALEMLRLHNEKITVDGNVEHKYTIVFQGAEDAPKRKEIDSDEIIIDMVQPPKDIDPLDDEF